MTCAVLIAIAGGSGAGKTWLARRLCRGLRPRAAILSLDDFYRDLADRPPSARARVNFDAPSALDWPVLEAALLGIRRGEAVHLPRYDFAHHTRQPTPRRWRPRPIVLVEGLWPWCRARLAAHYALRIYCEAPAAMRLRRRLARDVRQRGRAPDAVRRQWQRQVQPMHARFVHPQRRTADVISPADMTPDWLDALARRIRGLMPSQARTD